MQKSARDCRIFKGKATLQLHEAKLSFICLMTVSEVKTAAFHSIELDHLSFKL